MADKEGSSIDSQEFMIRVAAANGGKIVKDSTATTGDFAWLIVLVDCAFSAFTNNFEGTVVGITTIPAGTLIAGRTTAFTLSKGAVQAVNR